MVGAASHANSFLCNSMQLRTAEAFVRKSTCRGRNGLIWENLDEKMELLGHLKVIVPLDINLVQFARTKQNQTGSHIQKETVSSKEAANICTGNIFQTAKCPSMFLLEGSDYRGWYKGGVYNGCRLRSWVRSVVQELCHLNLISKLSTIDMIVLRAKYDLSCMAVLVNCARQHNNGKVIRKKENRNCQYLTIAELIF